EMCEVIIGTLAEDGLLHTKLDEMSLRHALPVDGLAKAKAIVQTFEPAGVAAEDLRECLLLQLERQGRKASLAYRIIDHHLEDLAHKRYTLLAKKLAAPPEQI